MSQFRNLVFEGGGVKGIAYAGALQVLEDKALAAKLNGLPGQKTKNSTILADIERVCGASAGAITACLLACGATANEINTIVSETSFRKFMDDSWGILRDSKRVLSEFGWYKGDAFTNWIKKQVQALTGFPDLTFGDLVRRKAADKSAGYRELYVVGTNLSTRMEVLFSAENTPDCPIWHAVRASMSIPLFFAAVQDRGNVLVDGGVAWNYPIDLFDEDQYVPKSERTGNTKDMKKAFGLPTTYGKDHVYNMQTLGFRISSKDEIDAEIRGWRKPCPPIDSFSEYAAALIEFILEMANRTHLHENDWHRTVFLDAAGIRATDFDLTEAQIQMLQKNGKEGATKYFDWFLEKKAKPINRVTGA